MPEESYKLIGWEIAATGQTIADEICQIGAYTPYSTFSQYILPREDVNPFAQRRYDLRVVTVSRYRMLKNLKTNFFLKTSSENSVLNEFVGWLEYNKGFLNDGVILVHYEVKNMAPLMLLYALKRHGLLSRFSAIVKGFCNICTVAKNKCHTTLKTASLDVLAKNLLHKKDEFTNALDRAKACFCIILHVAKNERLKFPIDRILDVYLYERYAEEIARHYMRSVESEENDLEEMKCFIDRQGTYRHVLKEIMKFDWRSRQNAIRIRRKLVEHNLDLNNLKTAWDKGGSQALQLLLKKVTTATPQEQIDMLTIFDSYFDPAKEAVAGNYFRIRRQSAISFWLCNNQRVSCSDSGSRSQSGASATTGTSARSAKP